MESYFFRRKNTAYNEEVISMVIKGYNNSTGYMGWVEWIGDYMLFASEQDYLDYIEDES